jgi:hypothetical protein
MPAVSLRGSCESASLLGLSLAAPIMGALTWLRKGACWAGIYIESSRGRLVKDRDQ